MRRFLGRLGPVRALLASAVLVVLLAVGLTALGTERGDGGGPGGIGGLRRLLEARGIPVSTGRVPQDGRTFFLARDLRGPEDAEAILGWAREGGRVVLADPNSAVAAAAGLRTESAVGGVAPIRRLAADCPAPPAVGVREVVAGSGDARWVVSPPAAVPCFAREGEAYLLQLRVGSGHLVALGGVTPLTNEHLRVADDAALAWNLLGAPGDPVLFADPFGSVPVQRGLWATIPPPARVALSGVVLGALLLLAARGRRLGPWAIEGGVHVPASELVSATAELYRRSRSVGHAAGLLQQGFRARVSGRLGMPRNTSSEMLASAAHAAAGIPQAEVMQVLQPVDATDERALVDRARALEALERRIEGGA